MRRLFVALVIVAVMQPTISLAEGGRARQAIQKLKHSTTPFAKTNRARQVLRKLNHFGDRMANRLEGATSGAAWTRAGIRITTFFGGLAMIGLGIDRLAQGDATTSGALIGGGVNFMAATPASGRHVTPELALGVIATTIGSASGYLVGAVAHSPEVVQLPGLVLGGVGVAGPALFQTAIKND